MCNLYSITRTQEAMRRLFRVHRDLLGKFPGLPAVYPDTMAPVVRTAREGDRELTLMRRYVPPCVRQRPFGIACARQRSPLFRVHRDLLGNSLADAFAGTLTRGGFKTIPATEETTNMQRIEEDSWLGDLDSNQD